MARFLSLCALPSAVTAPGNSAALLFLPSGSRLAVQELWLSAGTAELAVSRSHVLCNSVYPG